MRKQIDVDRIKEQVSIVDLVGYSYTVIGRGHTLTTAEHDSLKLFTRNNSWTWYSQSGTGGKALGGSVIDWHMHAHGCSYGEAIEALDASVNGGWIAPATNAPVKAIATKYKRKEWNMSKANRDSAMAHDRLLSHSEGKPGRDYLRGRGITGATCRLFGIGYDPQVYYGKDDHDQWLSGPAIVLPYRNMSGDVTGIRYRWLHPVEGQSKSFARGGSGFGTELGLYQLSQLDLVGSSTLFVAEGGMNAASIRQCGYDAVSVGSESTPVSEELIAYSHRYHFVICWFDKLKYANIAATAIDGLPIARSDQRDANDLLRSGELPAFIDSKLH